MNIKRIAYLLKSILPKPALRGIAQAGVFFGAGLPGDATFPSVYRSFQLLSRLGFDPHFCIDVGAYHGEWAQIFNSVFPSAKILMVEAQQGKQAVLESVVERFPGQMSMQIALLGPRDNEVVTFHEMETGSSVFSENSPYSRKSVTRTTRSLDSLVREGSHARADVLKLDVQGYELEVLKGASEILSHVEAILTEVSLVPVNSGCPLFAEVITFLDQAGFRLFDFCSQVRRVDGVLWQTDLLFLRKTSRFLPEPRLTKENWG